jgi:hypothetical protein
MSLRNIQSNITSQPVSGLAKYSHKICLSSKQQKRPSLPGRYLARCVTHPQKIENPSDFKKEKMRTLYTIWYHDAEVQPQPEIELCQEKKNEQDNHCLERLSFFISYTKTVPPQSIRIE